MRFLIGNTAFNGFDIRHHGLVFRILLDQRRLRQEFAAFVIELGDFAFRLFDFTFHLLEVLFRLIQHGGRGKIFLFQFCAFAGNRAVFDFQIPELHIILLNRQNIGYPVLH